MTPGPIADVPLLTEDDIVELPGQPGVYLLRDEFEAWRKSNAALMAPAGDDLLPNIAGEHLYRNLILHVTEHPPPCRDDWRFTADWEDLTDGEIAELGAICNNRCESLARCRIFAARERPTGGFWAGRFYTRPIPKAPSAERYRR